MTTDVIDFRNPKAPLDERVKQLIRLMTRDEKIESMMQYQPAIERLGIAAYKHGTEAAHGIAWLGKATSFPQPIGLGCTWDTTLMKQIGDAIGDEARVFYEQNREVHGLTLWAPTVDMERDPRWGRTEESYGEDPVLTGELAAALVQGLQGNHPRYYKAIATLKHFIGNNNELNRGCCSVTIDPRNMKEYYQAAFKIPFVKGGAKSMMTSYNAVNGTPTILLEDVKKVVKEEWNLNGFIVSDAGDLLGLVNDHHYFSTYKEAVAASIKAGIDSITDDKEKTVPAIYEALHDGLISEKDIDEALFNTFRVRFLLGEFDPPELNPYSTIPETKLMAPEHALLALEAAKKSIVLLKNEHLLLPLSTSLKTIAVVGPLANVVYRDWYSGTMPYDISIAEAIQQQLPQATIAVHDTRKRVKLYDGTKRYGVTVARDEHETVHLTEQDGEAFLLTDWDHGSYTLQREYNNKFLNCSLDKHLTAQTDEAFGWFVKEVLRVLPSVEAGSVELKTWNNMPIVHHQLDGSLLEVTEEKQEGQSSHFYLDILDDGMTKAVEAAKQSEVAVVVVGNHPLINGKEEIDRPSLRLPRSQQELIKRVYEVNNNTVVIIVSSYPYILGDIVDHCKSLIYLAHAGQEQGKAVSDMLFGQFSPAGRLNMTWYEHESQLTSIMDYDIRKTKRTYQFVESKVTFPFGHGLSYAKFSYHNFIVDWNKGEVSVTITNESDREAEEVVQLYMSVEHSKVERARKKLIAFNRILVPAKSRVNLRLPIDPHQLEVWDVAQEKFIFEQATYHFHIGPSSAQSLANCTLYLTGEQIRPRELLEWTKAESYNDYSSVELDEAQKGLTCVKAIKGFGTITFAQLAPHHPKTLIVNVCSGEVGGMLIVKSNDDVVGSMHLVASEEAQWKIRTIDLKTVNQDLTFEITGSVKLSQFKLVKGDTL